MSGETGDVESGWTTDTLHQFMQQQINDLAESLSERHSAQVKLLDERYSTQTKALDAAFAAQQLAMQTALDAAKEAVNTAMVASEKAVIKAENAAERRFESVNEFRAQLADQARTFMPRTEAEAVSSRAMERIQELSSQATGLVTRTEVTALYDRNSERIRELTDRMNKSEGSGVGMKQGWTYLVGGLSLLLTIVLIYMALRGGL